MNLINSQNLSYSLSEAPLNQAFTEVRERGFYVFTDLWKKDFCDHILTEIDALTKESGVEVNYGGSEHRIWNSQLKSRGIEEFEKFSNHLMSAFAEKQKKAFDILAYRNLPIQDDTPELIDGRWHIDSIRDQFKIFLFLKDVNSRNGPFQWIPNTHNFSFKLKQVLKGNYLRFSDILGKNRQYQNISDSEISMLLGKSYRKKECLVSAGTAIMINTSSIHRAKPCIEGSRYALCSYYDHN